MAAAAAAKKKRAGDSMTGIPVQLPYPLHMTTDVRARALLPLAQTAFAVRFALLLLSNNPSYFLGTITSYTKTKPYYFGNYLSRLFSDLTNQKTLFSVSR